MYIRDIIRTTTNNRKLSAWDNIGTEPNYQILSIWDNIGIESNYQKLSIWVNIRTEPNYQKLSIRVNIGTGPKNQNPILGTVLLFKKHSCVSLNLPGLNLFDFTLGNNISEQKVEKLAKFKKFVTIVLITHFCICVHILIFLLIEDS